MSHNKQFACSVLTNLLYKKRQNTNEDDYWSLSYTADCMLEKQPTLKKNLEKYWEAKPRRISKTLLVQEMSKLISFVRKMPISDRKYFAQKGEYTYYASYGGCIHKADVDFAEENMERCINIFHKDMELKTKAWSRFHKLESFVLDDERYKAKLFRKRKLSADDFMYIEDIFCFFKERYDAVNETKLYFSNKRFFKKSKKRLFAFHIKTSGCYYSIDWSYPSSNEFYIVCSHLNEDGAKKGLLYLYNNNSLVQGVIKNLSKNKIDMLDVKNVSIKRVEPSSEVVQKAKQNLQERFCPSYNNSYGYYFLSIERE